MTQAPSIRTIEILDAEVVRALQNLSPAQRIEIAYATNRLVRERLRAQLAHEHPDWTKGRLDAAVAERVLHGTS